MIIEAAAVNKNSELIEIIKKIDGKLEHLMEEKTRLMKELKDSESGILVHEEIKCGKSNCKCASGQRHGPYWYWYYWEKGKLKKKYICPVKKPDETFNELVNKINNNKINSKLQIEIKRINNAIIKINNLVEKFKADTIQIMSCI